jgi:hypothetical protein
LANLAPIGLVNRSMRGSMISSSLVVLRAAALDEQEMPATRSA